MQSDRATGRLASELAGMFCAIQFASVPSSISPAIVAMRRYIPAVVNTKEVLNTYNVKQIPDEGGTS
jgi:hypothetical protein